MSLLPQESKASPQALDATELRRLLVLMRLAREWDLRFENLLRTGVVSKWYSAIGNEALTVAAGRILDGHDTLLTLHRDVGAILAYFVDVEALLPSLFPGATASGVETGERSRRFLYRLACQMMGRSDGFTQGVERSYHYNFVDADTGRTQIGMISHLGAMIPVAAGCALAASLRDRQEVAINFIGDGGASTGDFHEGLNMAAVWKLPFVLVVENNGYAFSTPTAQQYSCSGLHERARSYGIPGVRVDGNDPRAVREVLRTAVDRARAGEGPTLVEAVLGRMRGHSEQDRSLDVVSDEELDRYQREDPLLTFPASLECEGVVDAPFVVEMEKAVRDLLIEVTDEAQKAPVAPAEDVLEGRFVFCPTAAIPESAEVSEENTELSPSTYVDAIRRALKEEMERDELVVLIGQDIADFGGAFRITDGFLERFGAGRVRNTPIAESGTIGIAVGAALLGYRPVVEMQFADFVSCGFNQLVNVAAKMFFRSRMSVPLVVRCPSGAGAGAGPFHSQNPESWFTHVPGLKVVAPAFPHDVAGLLKAAIRDPNPVLFFEHKHLYRHARQRLPEDEVLVPLGKARVQRPGQDLSIVTYGWMVHQALEAASLLEREGLDVEVLDLRTLVPLDEAAVLESVKRTSRALIVHEASLTSGFGGELAARLADEAFEYLDAPVKRLAFPDIPVPYEKSLEAHCLPDVGKIAALAREIVRY